LSLIFITNLLNVIK